MKKELEYCVTIVLLNLNNCVHPLYFQLLLEAPDDIHAFQFSPSDPNIIAGGCQNGQLVLWDISAHADRLKQPRGGNRKTKATVLVSKYKTSQF